MDTIVYQDHCYFCIHTDSIVGLCKSNLASNNLVDIDLPMVFVSIASTLKRILKCY